MIGAIVAMEAAALIVTGVILLAAASVTDVPEVCPPVEADTEVRSF